jgi:uncharacterized protein YuzE
MNPGKFSSSRHRHLEVTFRNGKAQAAYLYLNRRSGDAAARTMPHDDGYVVDFASDGRVIGVEITAPSRFSVASLNALLQSLGEAPVTATETSPLAA